MTAAAAIPNKWKIASLTDRHHPITLSILTKYRKYCKKKLESVYFSCKSHRSKTANNKIL